MTNKDNLDCQIYWTNPQNPDNARIVVRGACGLDPIYNEMGKLSDRGLMNDYELDGYENGVRSVEGNILGLLERGGVVAGNGFLSELPDVVLPSRMFVGRPWLLKKNFGIELPLVEVPGNTLVCVVPRDTISDLSCTRSVGGSPRIEIDGIKEAYRLVGGLIQYARRRFDKEDLPDYITPRTLAVQTLVNCTRIPRSGIRSKLRISSH